MSWTPGMLGRAKPGQTEVPPSDASQAGAIRVRLSLVFANIALLLFFGSLAYFFIFREMRFFVVPSSSMEPTLMKGDWIFTLNDPEYQRGDIVVIWHEEGHEFLVKRIAGVPGDEVTVEGGALFLNGSYASEPYIKEPMTYQFDLKHRIGDGQVLLLGDNRNQSDDSSMTHKTYPSAQIVGRTRFIYYPLDRRGALPRYPLRNALGN